jgi:hypothetical protein
MQNGRYEELVACIEVPAGNFDDASFLRLVHEDEDRIDLFVSGKIAETVTNLQHLERHDDEALARNVAQDILDIDTFVKQNLEGFRKAIKKYKKKTGLSAVWCACLSLLRN